MNRRFTTFVRDWRGSVTIEFTIVFVLALCTMMIIIETPLLALAQGVLNTRTTDVARSITNGGLLGADQSGAVEAIRSSICDDEALFLFTASSCRARLLIDIRKVDSVGSVPPILVNGQINGGAFGFQATDGGDVLLVRTAIEWPSVLPFWSTSWNNLKNGNHLIISSSLMKQNPYARYNIVGPQ